MITSTPKIFVDENEYDFETRNQCSGDHVKLDSETSVSRLKTHFFQTLAEIGEVVRYRREDAVPNTSLAKSLMEPGALVACFHESPPGLSCRLLQHTKGGLMLTGGFLGQRSFDHPSTVSLVTSRSQAERLRNAFSDFKHQILPFYPTIDSRYFAIDEIRNDVSEEPRKNDHLIYAGRWIANKGMCQMVRALNEQVTGARTLEFVGEFERDFPISQSGGMHTNYSAFHAREILEKGRRIKLCFQHSLPVVPLASRYRKAAAMIYASFHEDENYGLAPREAAACGAMPIVTDICGLGEFGRKARGGIVRTWPTLGGIRYSLKELASEVERVMSWPQEKRHNASVFNKELVASECSGRNSVEQMNHAIEALLALPIAPPPAGGWRAPSRLANMAEIGPPSFRHALRESSCTDPDGLYVEGVGYNDQVYSEARLLTAIQGLYTTWPRPPRISTRGWLHGFWRVGLWEDERALVEFGFPGPRLLRFSISEWDVVTAAAKSLAPGDFAFEIRDSRAVEVFQRAIDLGYLVPDDPMECNLPAPNDTLPSQGHHL
jgi:glycosyltransferase involved in cell wall biosynthesis